MLLFLAGIISAEAIATNAAAGTSITALTGVLVRSPVGDDSHGQFNN